MEAPPLLLSTLALLLISFTTLVSASGSYVVLSPNIIHPGWPLNLAVSIHKTTVSGVPVLVKADLKDTSGFLVAEAVITINAGQSRLLSMQIPADIANSDYPYQLKVEGSRGLEFKHAETLRLNSNSTILMVQTDKNIYKPGQLVRFRVIQVNKDLVPVGTPLTAFIVNTKGNKLERYDDLVAENGVVAKEFQLSKYASLGIWSIELQNAKEDVLYSQQFEVDEYVLPKFSVEVKPDPDFLIWGVYNLPPGIIVKSIYTYGKAVQGECFLTVGRMGTATKERLSKKIPESGTVEFTDINWNYIIGSKPMDKKTLLVQVEVKDIMGRTEYGEANIDVFRDKYKVEILPQTPEIIHNGLETEIFVRVSDHYDNPVSEGIKVTVDMPNSDTLVVKTITLSEQPYHKVSFVPEWQRESAGQDSSSTYLSELKGSVRAELDRDSSVKGQMDLYWYYSINLQSIQFEGPRELSISQNGAHTFKFRKTLSSEFSTTWYTVVGQGIILETGIVENNEVSLYLNFDMCPKARIVVYQLFDMDSEKEIVADSIEFAPLLCMNKEVKVSFDAREQRTGTDANLQINVISRNVLNVPKQVFDVFYLAVDKSIVLLQGDTSLTNQKILDVLELTNSWTRTMTQNTAANIFRNFNLKTLTNVEMAHARERPPIVYSNDARAGGVFPEADIRRKGEEEVAAQGKGDKGPSNPASPAKKIRKDFPDTWLWHHGKTTTSGQFRTQVRLPDTITSWHVSAFAINDQGIVGSATPFELTAFNPFFVSLNLPYSIKRGEVFSLRITVFNYRPQDVKSIIRLEMSDNFIVTGGQRKDNYMEQMVDMRPNLASVVNYQINASTIGKIKFHVVAQDVDDVAQRDEVIRELLVKPPGEERNQVITEVMLLKDQNSISKRFEIEWPHDEIIKGSQRLQLKVTGQVLGQSLSNLEHLVSQPVGCGEQNMITLVPNIYGATYILETDQKESKELVPEMTKNMNKGYQRQVDLYKRTDGAYSAWATDPAGSTWLTAFVMKSFAAASKFISVDSSVVREALSFLQTKQRSDGYFKEDGRVLHSDMQAGTSDELPLTVYCLLSALETKEMMPTYEMDGMISKSVDLILRSVSKIITQSSEKGFLPAMTAYTLSLAAKSQTTLNIDEQIAALLQAVEDAGAPWKNADDDQSTARRRVTYGSPTQLMTAAYTLLTHLKQSDMTKAFNVMKWIQSQQNSQGGFGSTQDTVLVLQSLSEFGIYYKKVDATGEVEVSVPDSGFSESLDISGSRSILLQQLDLPTNTSVVDVTLKGESNTVAFVKVVSFYNTPVIVPPQDSPSISKTVKLKTSSRYMSKVNHEVEACVSSTLEPGVGMYVTTLNLASGEAAGESPESIKARNSKVSQVEVEEGLIHFYMNDIPKEGYCVKAIVEQQMDFAVQEPGSARVYSYYEPEYFQESVLDLVDESVTCFEGQCGSAPSLPLTSLILTTLICFVTSLLACL